MADEDVTLLVNGQLHRGWQRVTIHWSIQELAPAFVVDYTQRWSTDEQPIGIRAGDSVDILIADSLALSAIVDECSEDYDATSHSVTCQGRSRTGQIVDCSAVYGTGSLAGQKLDGIASALCAPFGITVALSEPDLDVGDPVPQFQIQDGQSVFEALNDVARQEGVLLLSTVGGNLLLARSASVPLGVALNGSNIKRGSFRESIRERYSEYILKGQAPPATGLKGAPATQLKTTVTDDAVTLNRPLVIVDHQTTLPRLKQRAAWERNTRAGGATVFTYDVVGWFTPLRQLWSINTLVSVADPTLGFTGDLLITSVDFQQTIQDGRLTRLELMPRETFDVLKPPRLPKRKKGKPRKPAIAGL